MSGGGPDPAARCARRLHPGTVDEPTPAANFIGNAFGAVPAWARNPFRLGVAPNFASSNWRFSPGGAFTAPGMMPQATAPAAPPVKTGANDGFWTSNNMDGTGHGSANGGRDAG